MIDALREILMVDEIAINNPTPEGPVLDTPGRGYFALSPKGTRMRVVPRLF
jgi:hypothetical protein